MTQHPSPTSGPNTDAGRAPEPGAGAGHVVAGRGVARPGARPPVRHCLGHHRTAHRPRRPGGHRALVQRRGPHASDDRGIPHGGRVPRRRTRGGVPGAAARPSYRRRLLVCPDRRGSRSRVRRRHRRSGLLCRRRRPVGRDQGLDLETVLAVNNIRNFSYFLALRWPAPSRSGRVSRHCRTGS